MKLDHTNDCLVLLDYVAKHPNEIQTQKSLSDATGIPRTTISRMLRNENTLSITASEYGFEYSICTERLGRGDVRKRKRNHPQIIDVVYGRTANVQDIQTEEEI